MQKTAVYIDKETRDKVLKQFRKLEAQKDCCKELQELLDSTSYEDLISYKSAARIDSDVATYSTPSGTGQPERDALRIIESRQRLEKAKKNVEALENALEEAIKSAANPALRGVRKKIEVALYDNLVIGVPSSMLRISSATLAKYRNSAIEYAAINLGYVTPTYES